MFVCIMGAILVLVTGLATCAYQGQMKSLRIRQTEADIRAHFMSIELYRESLGRYPENVSDMLTVDPVDHESFLQPRSLLDVWSNRFVYRVGPASIEVVSAGPDGRIGTGDDIKANCGLRR